jgi:hypothetical protein
MFLLLRWVVFFKDRILIIWFKILVIYLHVFTFRVYNYLKKINLTYVTTI